MMGARVQKPWHKDTKGQKDPHVLVGEVYLHVKTSALYVVTGYSFNASTDCWAIHYDRRDESKALGFAFTRDMHEFLDGRFIKVT